MYDVEKNLGRPVGWLVQFAHVPADVTQPSFSFDVRLMHEL